MRKRPCHTFVTLALVEHSRGKPSCTVGSVHASYKCPDECRAQVKRRLPLQ